jgi:hypothetical protein
MTSRNEAERGNRELSDERLVSQSRLIALASTLPLALTGSLSLYVATRGGGRGDWAPWVLAAVSALLVLAVRFQQRHEGRLFVTASGLMVRTIFGKSVHIAWPEVEGAQVGRSPWGLPSRYPGFFRLRLRSTHPIVGRWVTTIAPSREEALGATREVSDRVRLALKTSAPG